MAEKKKMSVAEILAAARATGGGGAVQSAAPEAPPVAEAETSTEAAPKAKPPAKPAAAKPAGGARPSVADILAAARAKKAEGGEAAAREAAAVAKPKPPADKPKPAAKPAAAKADVASAAKTGVQRDTASILSAARGGAKPGPVSKADAPEVAAKLQAAAAKPKAVVEKAAVVRTAPPMPVRPVTPAAKQDAEEDRRGFLEIALGSFMAMGFTALSITGGLFTLGLARFMFPNVLAEPPSRFKVGFKEGFPAGKVETKFVPQYGVWVVNGEFQGQQQIYALKTVCTHLGCTPNWLEAEQKFKCPCHGSGFYKDGINFEGPAPRPLERYAIRISDDGQLEIDKSKAFQEELGQWADPDSYVSV
jgi:cytochrome b6-f complex iron-sulfur subunit